MWRAPLRFPGDGPGGVQAPAVGWWSWSWDAEADRVVRVLDLGATESTLGDVRLHLTKAPSADPADGDRHTVAALLEYVHDHDIDLVVDVSGPRTPRFAAAALALQAALRADPSRGVALRRVSTLRGIPLDMAVRTFRTIVEAGAHPAREGHDVLVVDETLRLPARLAYELWRVSSAAAK